MPDRDRLLAVVVLSVGAPPDLRGAVGSLVRQDPQPAEIVVVNSGGGDPAHLVRHQLPPSAVVHSDRLWRHGEARNRGIRATSADYVAFLSADCRALPGWVAARQHAHRAGQAVVSSAVVNRWPHHLASCAAHAALFSRRMPGTPSDQALRFGCSYDRELFDRFGGFDESIDGNEDTEFHERLHGAGITPAWVPEVMTAHPHPIRTRSLLRDQYRRGRRMAVWRLTDQGVAPGAVARDAFRRAPSDLRRSWRSSAVDERPRLVMATPLFAAAVTAYAIGAASARGDQP